MFHKCEIICENPQWHVRSWILVMSSLVKCYVLDSRKGNLVSFGKFELTSRPLSFTIPSGYIVEFNWLCFCFLLKCPFSVKYCFLCRYLIHNNSVALISSVISSFDVDCFFLVCLINRFTYTVTLRSLFKDKYHVSSIPNGDIRIYFSNFGCYSLKEHEAIFLKREKLIFSIVAGSIFFYLD